MIRSFDLRRLAVRQDESRLLTAVCVALVAAAAFAIAATLAASAQAQTQAKTQAPDGVAGQVQAKANAVARKVAAACKPDIARRCKSVTPGEGRILYCILAHGDKLTPKCAGAMIEVGRDVSLAMNEAAKTADLCFDDIEKLCANVPQGQGRIAQCLVDNRPKLTPACAGQLQVMQARVKAR